MKLQIQCFSIKVIPYSITPETHIVTLPAPERGFLPIEEDIQDEEDVVCKNAYKFLKKSLAAFLPPNLELEESSTIDGDNEGYFFSCSNADSDEHYYLLLQYTVI